MNTSLIALFVYSLLTSVMHVLFCLPCPSIERQYNCDGYLEYANQTVLFDTMEHYNLSLEAFIPNLKSMQYCQGSFHCKPEFRMAPLSDQLHTQWFMLCFKDIACLSDGGYERALIRSVKNYCTRQDCLKLKSLSEFNITNESLQVGSYRCVKYRAQGLKNPFCIKPACKSFAVIEKLCVCKKKPNTCTCSSYCEHLLTSTHHKTYALFFSFAEVYVTKGNRDSFIQWVILTALCFGLAILLIIFCKLCKAAMDPASHVSNTQNTEALRRILTRTLDSGNTPSGNTATKATSPGAPTEIARGSPPPTYEQVLKDKCVEFKNSVC